MLKRDRKKEGRMCGWRPDSPVPALHSGVTNVMAKTHPSALNTHGEEKASMLFIRLAEDTG